MSCCDRGVGEVCPLGLFSASEAIRPGKNQGTSRVLGRFPRSMRPKKSELSREEARKARSLRDSFKNHLAPFWEASHPLGRPADLEKIKGLQVSQDDFLGQ